MTFTITFPNLTSRPSIYVDRAFVVSGFLFNFVMFILIWRLQRIKRKDVVFTTRMWIMNNAALLVAFINALFDFCNTFIEFSFFPISLCRTVDAATASLWVVAKFFLYLFFLLRIDVVFRDSNYGLSSPNLTFWYVLIFIAVVLDLILVAMYWDTTILYIGNITFCSPNAPFFVYAHAITWDCFLSFSLITVFVRKIREAELKVSNSIDPVTKNKGLDRLLKFTVLGGTAIASTLFLICLVGVTQYNFPGSIDSMINTLMIYLTYDKQHRRILGFFKKACHCCIFICCPVYLNRRFDSTYTLTDLETPRTPRTRTLTSSEAPHDLPPISVGNTNAVTPNTSLHSEYHLQDNNNNNNNNNNLRINIINNVNNISNNVNVKNKDNNHNDDSNRDNNLDRKLPPTRTEMVLAQHILDNEQIVHSPETITNTIEVMNTPTPTPTPAPTTPS